MLGRIIQPVNLLLNLKSCSNAVIIGAQTIKLIINGNLKKVYVHDHRLQSVICKHFGVGLGDLHALHNILKA